jgi:hypothetical protein
MTDSWTFAEETFSTFRSEAQERLGKRRIQLAQPNGPASSNSTCAFMVSTTDDALIAAYNAP